MRSSPTRYDAVVVDSNVYITDNWYSSSTSSTKLECALCTHDRRALDAQVSRRLLYLVWFWFPKWYTYDNNSKGNCLVRSCATRFCLYFASSTGRSSMLVIRDRYMLPVRTDPKVLTEN